MSFNVKKCAHMCITLKRQPLVCNFTISDQPVPTATSCKYIGVTITDNLCWNSHAQKISSKAACTLGIIRRALGKCDLKVRDIAYKQLVRPQLEYASCAWNPHIQKDVNITENIQRQGARFVLHDYSRESSPPATESPNDDTDVQENALDNPTYEMDTGEQTNVDMPPPPPPDDDIPNDIDLIFDADDEIAANMDTDPSAVIDVNVVDENGDVVDEGDGNDIEDPDGVELPEYSYVDTVNEPVNEEAGPLPSKSMEDRRYESIKLQGEYLSEDELQRRKDKSLKICIGMFVVVLIGLAVGLIAFFITYSMRDLTSTTPEPTTEQRAATQPPIQIDYIVARLNITFNDKNFTEALNDPTSPEYQALFDEVTELVS
ncbi:uncharacterized protein LOC135155243 [Lytechinus pictus]|uniref:uncharacterized protein LOC135155243 n=1 Tax=Lytechinus pictus TaxID=7653 RepID=UPI0030B9D8A2